MAGLTRRETLTGAAARRRRPLAPQRLPPIPTVTHVKLVAVKPTLVSLTWRPVRVKHHLVAYAVFRGRRRIAVVQGVAAFEDRHVQPNATYTYRVCAMVGGRSGRKSAKLTAHTPRLPPPPPPKLTPAQVDRLFWRAGFGPSAADRQQWVGQPPSALVQHFLSAPYALGAPTTPGPTYQGNPIDPLASDPELQMEWLDRMQRVTNPFVERLNFFWHRHFAVSRDAGIPSSILLAYRDRLRRYSDLASNPHASFHDLAFEMTTQDAAMSLYLTGFLNQKNKPNENYAREFMELFTLGATDVSGTPNYSQNDVHELARAFTGYTLDQKTGTVSFNPALFDSGTKTILGRTGAFDAPAAIGIVLSHPSHGPFLIRKLWSEFIAAPIPADTQNELVLTYLASGLQLAPVLTGILSHPLMFDSLSEPTMIKPPVVYVVGVLRALGVPLVNAVQTSALQSMQQQPYHPPNVAGWDGGVSWMTTGTAIARFGLIAASQALIAPPPDVPGETATQAVQRAYNSCGAPWVSAATWQTLLSFASLAPAGTPDQRRSRFLVLCQLILGGPDGQVM